MAICFVKVLKVSIRSDLALLQFVPMGWAEQIGARLLAGMYSEYGLLAVKYSTYCTEVFLRSKHSGAIVTGLDSAGRILDSSGRLLYTLLYFSIFRTERTQGPKATDYSRHDLVRLPRPSLGALGKEILLLQGGAQRAHCTALESERLRKPLHFLSKKKKGIGCIPQPCLTHPRDPSYPVRPHLMTRHPRPWATQKKNSTVQRIDVHLVDS